MTTYHWRTDAAHGDLDAETVDAALAQIVRDHEWAAPESAREQRDLEAELATLS